MVTVLPHESVYLLKYCVLGGNRGEFDSLNCFRPEVGMSGEDDEIAKYLRSLLDHASECSREDCPSCQTLRGAFELIRNRLFSSPVYPQVMLATAVSKNQPMPDRGAGARTRPSWQP